MRDRIMEIVLPADMAHYEGELRYFFDSMIRKLYINRHRGFADNLDFETACVLIENEYNELRDAVTNGEAQFAAYFESVDVANTAFIAGLVLSRMSKNEYKALKAEKTNDACETSESPKAATRPPVVDYPDHQ